MNIDWMPGPTTQAKQLQLKQCQAREAMYDAWGEAVLRRSPENRELAEGDAQYLAAKAAYDATVRELAELLGAQAHCNAVDCDLWSLFSDAYKDEAGFRPRSHFTRQEVLDWLERLRERSLDSCF